MKTIGRLRYLEQDAPAGARPRGTLVLLHAFPVNARMWEGQLTLSAGGWRVVAPQFRGFDGGDGDPAANSMDDYAGDVVDLLDALHVPDAVIGGLSLGGYVAFALLRLAPHYVRGLILADTRPQADTPEGLEARRGMLALLEKNPARGAEAVMDQMLPKLVGGPARAASAEVVAHLRALGMASSAASIAGAVRALMTRPDSTPLLSTIHCPTLIVVGADDVITPPALSEEMHRAIAGSELVEIPAAGHMSNFEQPVAFNDAVARFLADRV